MDLAANATDGVSALRPVSAPAVPPAPPRLSRRSALGRAAVSAAGIAGLLAAVPTEAVAATPPASAPVPTNWINVNALGALGDDATDDAPAIRAAIAAAVRAGGGIVYLPTGTYRCLSSLVLPADTEINLVGEGPGASVLHFPNDLGSGSFAVGFSGPVATFTKHVLRDISISGPRRVDALGQAPAQMDGVQLASRVVLDRCSISWFRAGGVVSGDHQEVYSCRIDCNYYGLYWAPRAPTMGNLTVLATSVAGNKFAGLAVADGAMIDASTFVATHFGFSPYAIYREVCAGVSVCLCGTTFLNCAFESVGNALFYEETPGTSAIQSCLFTPASLIWDSGYRIASRPRDAVFTCYQMDSCELTISNDGGPWTPGAVAIFQFRGGTSGTTINHADYLLGNLGGKPIFAVAPGQYISGWLLRCAGAWSASVKQVASGGAVAAHDCVEQANGRIRKASSASASPPAGVALHAAPADGWVAIAVEGEVKVNGNHMITDTFMKKSSVPGQVMTATSFSDGPLVGTCLGVDGGGSTANTRLTL